MESDHVHFTLFNVDTFYQNIINDSNIKMSELVRETLGMTVLDSACSRIVAGKLWFDIFFDTLNNRDKCLVKTAKSNRTFCFDDGVKIKAINSVKFLVTIGSVKGVKVYIEADIVKNDLPLLLSHKSMKTAGMLLDFKNDSCRILGNMKLQNTTSGHYNLPLTNILLKVERLVNVVLHCEVIKNI